MSVLQICNCVLKVKDEMGNPYGAASLSNPTSAAELVFYTRKSQINSSDAIYLNKAQRAQAQPGVVVQDLIYLAISTPSSIPTVTYTGGGVAGSEVVTVVGNAISIQIQSGVSTATQIRTAFRASVTASAIANCIVSGTGSNTQTTQTSTSFSSEYCYLPLAETTTNMQEGVFELIWNDGNNYDTVVFDPFKIPVQAYQDLSSVLTISRG